MCWKEAPGLRTRRLVFDFIEHLSRGNPLSDRDGPEGEHVVSARKERAIG